MWCSVVCIGVLWCAVMTFSDDFDVVYVMWYFSKDPQILKVTVLLLLPCTFVILKNIMKMFSFH